MSDIYGKITDAVAEEIMDSSPIVRLTKKYKGFLLPGKAAGILLTLELLKNHIKSSKKRS